MTKEKRAISPLREEDFSEWYQQVIKAADLAENSPVRGCMVVKPTGYGIWENIQKQLDHCIKETGHENVYFPLFIPLSFFEREAAHVSGFAKECAVITHHRLEEKQGRLVPAAPLEEPLVVRPTSEAIIGDAFSRWISSYRDLPLLINQWANVVRWEMRPRIFLRTTEFLWQEGHTAHASAQEALEETLKMLQVYHYVVKELLAIPVIIGEKSPAERFPGAKQTFTLEAMMQDRKALQTCTSHDLGQNFAKAFNIKFSNPAGELEYAHTTSWGMTTRLIGSMIMCHGDDDGLRVPPRVAPKQIVIIAIIPKPELKEAILNFADQVATALKKELFYDQPITVFVDKREKRGGEKVWEWVKKGVPIRLEIGPKEVQEQLLAVARRDAPVKEKKVLKVDDFVKQAASLLQEIQDNYYSQALAYRDAHLYTHLKTFSELKDFFTPKNEKKPEAHGGFVLAKWCGDTETEKMLADLKISIRCLPLEQSNTEGTCILTGRPATIDAIFAKSY